MYSMYSYRLAAVLRYLHLHKIYFTVHSCHLLLLCKSKVNMLGKSCNDSKHNYLTQNNFHWLIYGRVVLSHMEFWMVYWVQFWVMPTHYAYRYMQLLLLA